MHVVLQVVRAAGQDSACKSVFGSRTMSEPPIKGLTPWSVAISVLLTIAVVLGLYYLDQRQERGAFTPNEALSMAEYEIVRDRHRREYAIWTTENLRRVYEWDLRSAKYIFWISAFISLSGIAFAFWQFAQASSIDREMTQHDELEIKTQLASLSFKSRSIASLVLFVSVAYMLIFTIFLHGVEITEDPVGAPDVTSDAGGPSRQGGQSGPIRLPPE